MGRSQKCFKKRKNPWKRSNANKPDGMPGPRDSSTSRPNLPQPKPSSSKRKLGNIDKLYKQHENSDVLFDIVDLGALMKDLFSVSCC